jgi:iron complex outermembrane receptor protein
MTIGLPDSKMGAFVVNAEYPLSEITTMYAFDVNIRKGTSYALYSLLDFRSKQFYTKLGPLIMDSNLHLRRIYLIIWDLSGRSNVFGFNADFSLTAGSNKVDYTVENSLNVSLGANSPTEFATGGYTFSQLVGNADFQELSIRSLSVLEQKLEGTI